MDSYSYAVGFDEGYEAKEQECYQCELFPKIIPQMPEEYKGKMIHEGGFTDTEPRSWTDEEISWVKLMKEQGFKIAEIAASVGRSPTSVQIKLKRLGKTSGSYNAKHIEEKYKVNKRYIRAIKPKTVLDCYCGLGSFYRSNFDDIQVISNDKDESIEADYHMDAFRLLCKMYVEKRTFDVIDLDPFGSAYDCFDLAFKMARKGVVITFGEMGHKRWKRLDFVRTHYGIDTLDDFNTDALINVAQRIAARNKKRAIVFQKCDWQNISRVWFTLEPIKITEQWSADNSSDNTC